jgi:transposase
MKTYIGIDLHKVNMTWVGIGEKGNEKLFIKEWPVTPEGVTEGISFVKNSYQGEIIVAIEPCCGWMWVYDQLTASKLEVHITNPRKVRAIADSLQKTDENDAHTLAVLLRTGIMHESRILSPETKKLRSLVRERSFFVQLRASVKCRLEGVVTREGRHLIKGSLSSKKGTDLILATEYTEWKEHLLMIEDMTKRIAILEKELTLKAKDLPICKLLQTIPGVGPISALTIHSEIGDFKAFKRPEQLAAFAGLVPTERSSGGVQRLGHITHAGSKYLRYILVEAAMHIRDTEKSAVLYDFYKNIRERSGKMRARVALARKMLTISWYMVTKNEVYQARPVTI